MGSSLFRRRYSMYPLMVCLLLIAVPPRILAQSASKSNSAPAAYEIAMQAIGKGDYREALKYLQDAVSQSAENLDYQYTLATVYLRMQRVDEAESILRALLEADPQRFQKAYFDLAGIYSQKGNWEEALAALRKARSLDPGRAEYETGLAYMSLKDYAKAVGAFEKAAMERPDLAPQAMTQQALAEFYLKRFKEAKVLLKKVLAMKITEENAEEVRKLLKAIEVASQAKKPWQVSATFGVQYDDNVYQNPLDAVNQNSLHGGVRNEDDVVFLTALTGRYSFIQQEPWELGVRYTHYMLTYLEHSDLNLIGASPSIYAQWEQAPYAAGLEYMYSHFWADSESRVDVHSIFPRFVMTHGSHFRTEAIGGVDWRFYQDDTPDDRVYHLGLTEMYLMREGKAHLRAGYLMGYDDMVPDARADYFAHEAMVGFQWPVWQDKWFADLSGRLIWRDYDFDPEISLNNDRQDDEQNVSVQLMGQLTSYLQMTLLFQHIWNDSNIVDQQNLDPYHYRRAVYTCMFTFNY